jgi:hypothetical protein
MARLGVGMTAFTVATGLDVLGTVAMWFSAREPKPAHTSHRRGTTPGWPAGTKPAPGSPTDHLDAKPQPGKGGAR